MKRGLTVEDTLTHRRYTYTYTNLFYRANLRSEMDYFAKFGDKRLNVDLLIDFLQYNNNSLTLTKPIEV
jgi:hypothetical protein